MFPIFKTNKLNTCIKQMLFSTMKRSWVLITLLFVAYLNALGRPTHDYYFEQLTIANGLSQNHVTCISQDSQGFLWFGTPNGLNKYDGYQIKEYDIDDVSAIFCDSCQQIYVSTHTDLYVYCPQRDEFESIRLCDSSGDKIGNALSFHRDREGVLWIGTANGMVYAYYPEEQRIKEQFPSIRRAPVRALTSFRDSLVLSCGDAQGIMHWDKQRKQVFRTAADSLYIGTSVTSLLPVGNQELWLGSYDKGLFRYGEKRPVLENKYIQDLCLLQDSLLLVALENDGLLEYNIAQRSMSPINAYRERSNLNSNAITCLYADATGILWVGTTNGGINKFDPNRNHFRYISLHTEGLPWQSIHSVFALCELDEENLLIGLDNKGIYVYNRQTGKISPDNYATHFPELRNAPVNAVLHDSRGLIWIGTYQKSMKVIGSHPECGPINRLIEHTLPASSTIKCIYEDTQKRIWIGTSTGEICCYYPSEKKLLKYDKGVNIQLQPNVILSLYEDNNHRIWAGSMGGLYTFDEQKQEFRQVYLPDGENLLAGKNVIVPICQVNDVLWLGTQDGLIEYPNDAQHIRHYTTADGLPSSKIKGLLWDDANHQLWISTDKGLSSLNMEHKTFTNFGLEDGIANREFNYMSYLCTRDGEFFFGSVNGIYHFHPKQIQNNLRTSRLVITGYQLYDHTLHTNPIADEEVIRIPYSESTFSISYVALNYTNTRKNEYAYRLKNYDEQWKYVGTQRMATYTHLNPGTYYFEVIGSNSNGIWNKEGATIKIIILPPWYRTTKAYVVYFLIIFSFFYFLMYFYANRVKMKSQLANEQFERKQLEKLNQLKMQFFSNVTHEFRTPLTLIISPLDNIIQQKVGKAMQENYLKIIQNNAIKLLKLVNELLDFSKSEAGYLSLTPAVTDLSQVIEQEVHTFIPLIEAKRIQLDYVCQEPSLVCMADKSIIQKIVSNLLSNAIKHTPEEGRISVSLEKKNDRIQISIQDSGKGIPEDQQQLIFERFYQMKEDSSNGTGIGLALVKNLTDLHHGSIRVESQVNKGSTFIIEIPYVAATTCAESDADNPVEEAVLPQEALHVIEEGEYISTQSSQRATILIAEDNKELRIYISSLLAGIYKVIAVENGKLAWETVQQEMPDLILSDIVMPEMDGKAFCHLVKQNIHTCHIPFIMITALTAESCQKEALNVGADDYLTKPFNSDILLSKISNILHSRALISRQVKTLQAMEPEGGTSPDKDSEFLLRLIEIIKANLSNSELKIDDLGKELGMSHTPFYKKIKQLTNQTPNDFLKSIRLEQARKLLTDGNHNISEVAYLTGFNSPKYFRECFKKQYGENPTDYQERMRK